MLASTLAAFPCLAAPPGGDPPAAETQAQALGRRLDQLQQTLQRRGKRLSPALLRLSLKHELARLRGLLRRRRPPCDPTAEVARLEADLAGALAGRPVHQQPGVHRLAYHSHLDGRSHPFAVAVPRGYSAKHRYPLVVMLHGMGGEPVKALGRVMGIPDEQLGPAQVVCSRPRLPRGMVPALVVAPNGFGDARFRGPGAVDVQAVLRRVMRLYRVDRRRVSITGLSMGGTGAVELALQRPQQYSGVVALCGYYDRRLDYSTQGQPLLPWERHAMSVLSATDWAGNAQGLPLVLIHGKKDGPQRSRSMQRAYSKAGHKVELELYPVAHNVWTPGYAGGRALKRLAGFRQGRVLRAVSFSTALPRVRRSHWVEILRLADHRRWARIHARVAARDQVVVSTTNVAAMVLDLPVVYLARRKPVLLTVDGAGLQLPASRARWSRRVKLWRGAKGWAVGQAPPDQGLVKRAGLSGPMSDVFNEPVVVVYGTGGGQGRLLRHVARRLARSRRVSLRYPVVSDRRFRRRRYGKHAVILVGNEKTNRVLARLGPSLPIRVDDQAVRWGGRVHQTEAAGALYIYPNPDNPGRYLLVAAGTNERAYELLRKLPAYRPDYMVFDEKVDIKRNRPVVGDRRVLVDGGYFDERWRLVGPKTKNKE